MAGTTPLVLIVEDDPGMLRLVRRSLELTGYQVLCAGDGPTGLELASSRPVGLLLLDLLLPGMDGLTVCRRIREFSDMHIIMMTAVGREEDIIRGLDAGADDYLPKPFSIDQLLARVRAVLRRARPATPPPRSKYVCGGLEVDFAWHRVTVHGREVRLTPTEYNLLVCLASHPGVVLTIQQILERVWGEAYADDRHLLQTNVGRLRRKIEPDPEHPRYVQNTPGVGYAVPKADESANAEPSDDPPDPASPQP